MDFTKKESFDWLNLRLIDWQSNIMTSIYHNEYNPTYRNQDSGCMGNQIQWDSDFINQQLLNPFYTNLSKGEYWKMILWKLSNG